MHAAPAPAVAVVAAAVCAVVAGQSAPASVERKSAVASGPRGCRRLASGSWNRARCPRSSRSHRLSRVLRRSCCGIAALQLRSPRPSPATANRPAPRNPLLRTRLAFSVSRVPRTRFRNKCGSNGPEGTLRRRAKNTSGLCLSSMQVRGGCWVRLWVPALDRDVRGLAETPRLACSPADGRSGSATMSDARSLPGGGRRSDRMLRRRSHPTLPC